jgi:hypothetical protein
MGLNCAHLIVDLFLYRYEDERVAKLIKGPSKHSLISLFNNNSRYLGDILTVNNPSFLTWVHPRFLVGFVLLDHLFYVYAL